MNEKQKKNSDRAACGSLGCAAVCRQRTDSGGCGGGREDTGCGVHTRYPLPSEQFFHSD